jgi:predicted type IV restriction endonuclease
MKKEIVALLDTFKTNEGIEYYDVSRKKQAVVMRLLNTLGWDPFNVDEVYPEYPVDNGIVDFALRHDNSNKVFISVKETTTDLNRVENSVMSASEEAGADIAVLTDGIEWWFYLPQRDGDEKGRKFHNLEIKRQDSDELARKFITFLSKDWVVKGKSEDSAQKVFRSRKKKRLIREALAETWNEFTRSSDNEFVRLLAEESEKLSGYPPDADDVASFLKSIIKKGRMKKMQTASVVKVKEEKAPAKKRKTRVKKVKKTTKGRAVRKTSKSQALSSRSGAFIGKKPEAFTFLGRRHKVKKWKEVLINVCNILSKAKEGEFEKVLGLEGRKRKYFSKDPAVLKEPRLVSGTRIYVETNFNASNLYMIAVKVLSTFGHTEQDLLIETR